jgi:pimeloyl-ACP methyl ester carboxylesterase
VFDSPEFNARLFFPRPDRGPPPPGARDLFVDVPGARLHLRWHTAATPARAVVLLFHGNGEVVADYDDLADHYAAAGAELVVVDFRGYGASTGVPTLRAAIATPRPPSPPCAPPPGCPSSSWAARSARRAPPSCTASAPPASSA